MIILSCRLTFTPNKSVVHLSRKDSYTPDPDLENKVQEMLSHQELDREHRLEKIDEEFNGNKRDVATSPKEYHLNDIRPRRSRTYRSSVYIKMKTGEEKA